MLQTTISSPLSGGMGSSSDAMSVTVTSPTCAFASATSAPCPASSSPTSLMTAKLTLEVVRIKRIPQREFEQAASSVVTLTPNLVTFVNPAEDLRGGGSGCNAAFVLAAINNSPVKERCDTAVSPAIFATQQVFHDNDPFYNDKVEFVSNIPFVDDEVATIQGYPAGVTLPSVEKPSAATGGNGAGPSSGPLPPAVPKPPTSRKSIVGPVSPLRRASEASALQPAASQRRGTIAPATLTGKEPIFRIAVTVHDHNRPTTPVLILSGLLEIPAVQTKGDVTISVALTPDPKKNPCSSELMRDEADVTAPLLFVRYKVSVVKPPREPIDQHADVLLEAEPVFTPDHQLVPDVTQYSWYHLLHDRVWLQGFCQNLLAQWSVLPKIIYEGDAGRKSPKKKPPTGTGGGSGRKTGAAVSINYKSIADLMINHWSVKRSHEAVTRIRIVADKYSRNEPLGFTAAEEYALKVQWRERQVLRTAMSIDLLSDYSASQVRVLLDRLWLNMVYGVPADDPTPPLLTYEMRNKLQSISFLPKHATILRACMLQHLVHGMTYADALKIATEDFEQKNLTYVSRRSSLIGGEFTKSEGIMMAFGVPVQPTVLPPFNAVPEIEQLHRLMDDNKKNMKAHQRRSKSREKRDGDEAGGDSVATLNTTMSGTVALAGTVLGQTMGGGATLNSTMATLAGVTLRDGGQVDLGVGANGCPRKESDFPTPTNYTSQKVFTTVVIDFVGRLLETLTDHEFIMILTAFIPAVTAASEKCLMVASGLPSTLRMTAGKRGSSASKARVGSAKGKGKKKRAGSVSVAASGGADGKAKDHVPMPSGPVQIEYLDSLGRKLPKREKDGSGSAAEEGAHCAEHSKEDAGDAQIEAASVSGAVANS